MILHLGFLNAFKLDIDEGGIDERGLSKIVPWASSRYLNNSAATTIILTITSRDTEEMRYNCLFYSCLSLSLCVFMFM